MYGHTTLFGLIASAVFSLAGPITKREVGGILICEGPNATGKCTYQVYPLETCNTLDPVFNGKVATFALDGEGFYCYPHLQKCGGICTSPTGCTFGAVTFEYANKYNLTAIGWDTMIESFDCHLNQTSSGYSK